VIMENPEATPYAWTAIWGVTSQQLQSYLAQWSSQGYQPVHLEGYNIRGIVYFAMIGEKKPGAWSAQYNISGIQFNITNNNYVQQGFHLARISAYDNGFGSTIFAGIWVNNGLSAAVQYFVGLGYSDLVSKVQYMSNIGYWPVQIESYTLSSASSLIYAVIFNQQLSGDPAWQAQGQLFASQYQLAISNYQAQGYRPYQLQAATLRGTNYFGGIWIIPNSPQLWQTSFGLTTQTLQTQGQTWSNQGYQFTDIQGYASNTGDVLYSALWDQVGLYRFFMRHLSK